MQDTHSSRGTLQPVHSKTHREEKKAALSSLPVSRREIEAQRNPLICPCSPNMFMAESRTKSSPQIVQSCFLHNCTCSFLSRWMQPPPFLQKAFHCSRYFKLGLQSWEWFNTRLCEGASLWPRFAPCFARTLSGKSSSPCTCREKFLSLVLR